MPHAVRVAAPLDPSRRRVQPAGLSNASAAVADRLLLGRLGLTLTSTRKIIQATASLGPAAAFLILALNAAATPRASPPAAPPPPGADLGADEGDEGDEGGLALMLALLTALSTVALGLGAFTHSGYWANIMDVAPRHAGVLLGISNTLATLPGILCNLTTGWILQALGMPGWTLIFASACGLELAGTTVYLAFASAKPQF